MRTDPDTEKKRSQPKLKILDRCQNPLQNKREHKPSISVQDPTASRRGEHHSGLAQDQRSSILTKVSATTEMGKCRALLCLKANGTGKDLFLSASETVASWKLLGEALKSV